MDCIELSHCPFMEGSYQVGIRPWISGSRECQEKGPSSTVVSRARSNRGRLLGNGAKPCENLLREDDNKVDSRSDPSAPNGLGRAKGSMCSAEEGSRVARYAGRKEENSGIIRVHRLAM